MQGQLSKQLYLAVWGPRVYAWGGISSTDKLKSSSLEGEHTPKE